METGTPTPETTVNLSLRPDEELLIIHWSYRDEDYINGDVGAWGNWFFAYQRRPGLDTGEASDFRALLKTAVKLYAVREGWHDDERATSAYISGFNWGDAIRALDPMDWAAVGLRLLGAAEEIGVHLHAVDHDEILIPRP